MRDFGLQSLLGLSILIVVGCSGPPQSGSAPAKAAPARAEPAKAAPPEPASSPVVPSAAPSEAPPVMRLAGPDAEAKAEARAILASVRAIEGHEEGAPWSVTPRPSWVVLDPWRPEPDDDSPVALSDQQVNFDGPRSQRYYRMIYRNRTEDEVGRHRALKVNFLPPHRHVQLHTLAIHRGDAIVSQINPFTLRFVGEDVEIVPEKVGRPRRVSIREPALLMHTPELQVGDTLVVEYTIVGLGDPRLEVFSAAFLSVPGNPEPADLLRYRVIADPREPPLEIRRPGSLPAPKELRRRGRREYRWQFKDVPAHPEGEPGPERIEISSFPDWDTVARLSRPFFELGAPLPQIRAIASRFAREHDDKAAQVAAAIDFVQHRLGFDTTDLDRWTSEPRPLAEILRRGATDCKGKTFLLLALLRELGVDAEPVLVNLDYTDLRAVLPSPSHLNHAIVALRVDGRELFVDPTRQGERGALWATPRLYFGTGLSLAPDRGLVDIPHPCDDPEPGMATNIHFRLGPPGQPTPVDVRRSLRRYTAAELAQQMADMSAKMSPDQLGMNFTGRFGLSHVIGEVSHHEDPTREDATTALRVVIPDIWGRDESGVMVANLGPGTIDRELIGRDPEQLKNPRWFAYYRGDTTVDLPEASSVTDTSFEIVQPGFHVRHTVTVNDRQVVARSEIRACGRQIRDAGRVLESAAELPQRMALLVRSSQR